MKETKKQQHRVAILMQQTTQIKQEFIERRRLSLSFFVFSSSALRDLSLLPCSVSFNSTLILIGIALVHKHPIQQSKQYIQYVALAVPLI